MNQCIVDDFFMLLYIADAHSKINLVSADEFQSSKDSGSKNSNPCDLKGHLKNGLYSSLTRSNIISTAIEDWIPTQNKHFGKPSKISRKPVNLDSKCKQGRHFSFLLSPTFDHSRFLTCDYTGGKKITPINLYSNILPEKTKLVTTGSDYPTFSRPESGASCVDFKGKMLKAKGGQNLDRKNSHSSSKNNCSSFTEVMPFLHVRGYRNKCNRQSPAIYK